MIKLRTVKGEEVFISSSAITHLKEKSKSDGLYVNLYTSSGEFFVKKSAQDIIDLLGSPKIQDISQPSIPKMLVGILVGVNLALLITHGIPAIL